MRLRPRVPAEDTLTVQAPVILTFTSVVEVSQILKAEPPEMVPFSQVRAEELVVGEKMLEQRKASKNEKSPRAILRTGGLIRPKDLTK